MVHRGRRRTSASWRRRTVLLVWTALWTAPGPGKALAGTVGEAPGSPDYTREVRPILSHHCFKCHGPDDQTRKAGLRLDDREAALAPLKNGRHALVPGNADSSAVIQRIFTGDEDDVMPPRSTGRPLTPNQKETLRRWVDAGAPYEPHWAFVPPRRAPRPEVKAPEWPRNGIDAFVLSRLEATGLAPSGEADRRVLIRRVSQDLIGLPPSPEDADAFAANGDPAAYEQLVDRLLASPHYGERWARRWLDLARYADTNGFEKDRPRSMWPWRDWVIQALNGDMPFDQFTIEQLAGDLLPGATVSQRVATGFHRNTMLNEEGGIDPLEYRFYSVVDRLNATGTTWLGLTVGCAQCHTHKYDPITQREYYGMLAFLNNADEPVMDVPSGPIATRRGEIEARIALLEADLVNQFPPEAGWREEAPAPQCSSSAAVTFSMLPDGSARAEQSPADKDTYVVTMETALTNVGRIKLEVLPDDSLPAKGPGWSESGNFVLNEISVTAAARDGSGQPVPLVLHEAVADFSQDGFDVARAIDGKPDTGWAVAGGGDWHVKRTAFFRIKDAPAFASGTRLTVRLDQQFGQRHLLGRFRLSLAEEEIDPRPLEIRRRAHRDRRFEVWAAGERERARPWTLLKPVAARGSVPVLSIEEDGSVFVTSDQTKSDTYEVTLNPAMEAITALRLEVLPDDRLPRHGPGRVDYEGPIGDFFLSTFSVSVDGRPVSLVRATASYSKDANHDAAKTIDADAQSGWSIDGGQGRRHTAVFTLAEPLAACSKLEVRMLFEKHYSAGLGRFRLWATGDTRPAEASALPDDLAAIVARVPGAWSATDREKLLRHFVTVAPELEPARKPIVELRRELPAYPTTLVMQERPPGNPRRTFVHHRGEFLQLREAVEPGVPAVLPGLPADAPRNRLSFARWLVDRDNPLTARVVVNREWAAFFGRGLVRTPGDFGFQGEIPSHPELLDWLAVEFMEQGWSLKRLHRLIVTSATYRQVSALSPTLRERDPENVLLARGPRGRLEAELVRDNALAAAGLLSPKLGGPSVFPPQLESITKEGTYGPLEWKVSAGEDRYRRGLYTFAKRTAPYATFNTFDAPSGEICVARREVSNTPLQALTLLNDEVFFEAAQALGRRAAGLPGADDERAAFVFRCCLTRPPDPPELESLRRFHGRQREYLREHPDLAAELAGTGEGDVVESAAWAAVARAILNLDEAVTRN